MHADEDGVGVEQRLFGEGVEVADGAGAEGEVDEGVADGFVDAEGERAMGCGDGEGFEAFDEGVLVEAELDEVGDGAEGELVLGAEFLEVGEACHGAVLGHDFDDDAGGLESGEAAEVDGAFGLAGAFEDPPTAGAEGEDVAGAGEVGGASGRVDEEFDGGGAFGGGDAGGDAEAGVTVDGDGEGGAEGGGVIGGLGVEVETVAVFGGEGDAEDAAGLFEHEVDDVGGDELCGADEVAFVFAVFIVDEYDHAAGLEGGEDEGNRSKRASHERYRNW